MATLNLKKATTVAELKKEFNENFGSQVRLYSGRSQAEATATLQEIGLTAEGVFECRSSLTVASFIERMQAEFGLKVKVYTCDDWVACLDGLTLESTGKVKKNAVKADMVSMIAYQHNSDALEEEFDEDEEVEDVIGECVLNNVSYDIFETCAFAQYIEDDDSTDPVVIPDVVTYKGKDYPVTYWGAGGDNVTQLELGRNVKDVDALHAGCSALKSIIVHSPKGYIVCSDVENDDLTLEQCYPNAEIKYVEVGNERSGRNLNEIESSYFEMRNVIKERVQAEKRRMVMEKESKTEEARYIRKRMRRIWIVAIVASFIEFCLFDIFSVGLIIITMIVVVLGGKMLIKRKYRQLSK